MLESTVNTKDYSLDELKNILNVQPRQDFFNNFSQIIDSLFLNEKNNYSFFGKLSAKEDNSKVYELLKPNGLLIRSIFSLLISQNKFSATFNYPISRLSPELQTRLNEATSSSSVSDNAFRERFYNSIYCVQNQVLCLNVFEYYFVSFIQHLTKITELKKAKNLTIDIASTDTLYWNLLREYMEFFYYKGDQSVWLINAALQTNQTLHKMRYGQIRLFNNISNLGDVSGIAAGVPGALSNLMELMYFTDTFVNIVLYLWFDCDLVYGGINPALKRRHLSSCSPNRHSIPQTLQMTVGHIFYARLFLKHSYNFCFSKLAVPPEAVAYLTLQIEYDFVNHLNFYRKQQLPPLFMRYFTAYLLELFRDWPADLTFKIVHETWLSAIQPWRYIDSPHHNQNAPNPLDMEEFQQHRNTLNAKSPVLDWYIIVLLCRRFLRMDMMNPCNNQLLIRMARVLPSVVDKWNLEAVNKSHSVFLSSNCSDLTSNSQFEGLGFEVEGHIVSLLLYLNKCISKLKVKVRECQEDEQRFAQTEDWISPTHQVKKYVLRLTNWVADQSRFLFSGVLEEPRKTSAYYLKIVESLEQSVSYLSKLFKLEMTLKSLEVEEEPITEPQFDRRTGRKIVYKAEYTYSDSDSEDDDDNCGTRRVKPKIRGPKLTELGRMQIIMGYAASPLNTSAVDFKLDPRNSGDKTNIQKSDPTFSEMLLSAYNWLSEGLKDPPTNLNYYEVPITSKEFYIVAKLSEWTSKLICHMFYNYIAAACARQNLFGQLSRHTFLGGHKKKLPVNRKTGGRKPYLRLRLLANKPFLLWGTLLLLLVYACIFWGTISFSAFLGLCLAGFFIMYYAVLVIYLLRFCS